MRQACPYTLMLDALIGNNIFALAARKQNARIGGPCWPRSVSQWPAAAPCILSTASPVRLSRGYVARDDISHPALKEV